MAELFELVEGNARTQARDMGFTVVRVISTTIMRIDVLGTPRYQVASETLNADNVHSELIENCTLSAITRAISFQEQRQYSFSVELDARLRASATGMASLVEFIQVPGISGSTATQQATVNVDVTLGAALRGQQSTTKTYRDDTTLQALPCTRTKIDYRVRNRTLAGNVAVDLRVIAAVVMELRLNTPSGVVTIPLPLPVDLPTTATGTFAGLVADEMTMQTQQVACRDGMCGMLSNEQIGRYWRLDGAPVGAIPVEFETGSARQEEDKPPGVGKCYPMSGCSGGSYASTYAECVADPVASSWKGPDGTCHEIRSDD